MSFWLFLMLAARAFPLYRFESELLYKSVPNGQPNCDLASGHRFSDPSHSSYTTEKPFQIIEDIDSNDWAVIRSKFVNPKCACNDEQRDPPSQMRDLQDRCKSKIKQFRCKKTNKNSTENKYDGEEMNERDSQIENRNEGNDDEKSGMILKRFLFKKINKGSSKSKSHGDKLNDNVSKIHEKDIDDELHETISNSESETHKGNGKKVRELRKQMVPNTNNTKECISEETMNEIDSEEPNRRDIIDNETSNNITKRFMLNNTNNGNNVGEEGKIGMNMVTPHNKQFKRFLFKKVNKKSSKKNNHGDEIHGSDAKIGEEVSKKDQKRFLFKKVNKSDHNGKLHEGDIVESDSKQKFKDDSVKEEKGSKKNDVSSLVVNNDEKFAESRNERCQ